MLFRVRVTARVIPSQGCDIRFQEVAPNQENHFVETQIWQIVVDEQEQRLSMTCDLPAAIDSELCCSARLGENRFACTKAIQ